MVCPTYFLLDADRLRKFIRTDNGEDYEAYVKRMACNGVWGDNITPQAAADAYGARIYLVTTYEDENSHIIQIDPAEPAPPGGTLADVYLGFIAEVHYSSTLLMGGDADSDSDSDSSFSSFSSSDSD